MNEFIMRMDIYFRLSVGPYRIVKNMEKRKKKKEKTHDDDK